MNREVLFRGKRKENGEWTEGDLRQDKDLGTCYIGDWNYYYNSEGLQREPFEYEVIPETVGQYTGLDDKNGKKIFEGDIVVTNKFRTPEVKYAVVYDKEIAAYIGTYKKGYVEHFTTFSNDGDEFEVIGSVYDGGLNDGKHSAEN